MRIPWLKEKFNRWARVKSLLTYDIHGVDIYDLIAGLDSRVSISCAVFHNVANADLRSFLGSTNDSKAKTQSLSLECHFYVVKLVL